ncbi:hypothetical protein GCM10008019_17310 [Deinococcus soli (ex Cha et al. 2016)]|nr:hypothetical protein GCM10008019_17310 [Deinococcus soli (ex Cha et al. 2016)]
MGGMPVLFVHGVAVREEGDLGWEDLHRATQGVDWPGVQRLLREHVTPGLNPDAPESVHVERVYWGDLGAHFTQGGQFRAAREREVAPEPDPLTLDGDALGEALERRLRAAHPVSEWPGVIRVAWGVARDARVRALLADLPPAERWGLLDAAVQARLPAPARRLEPHLPPGLMRARRRNVKRAMQEVRRPLEAFVPLFLGDVLAYLNGRGTPERPGAIPQRVLAGLRAAHAARTHPHEPLVVLTHSMGGQLIFDALHAFLPADPDGAGVRVDFWCACASQVGAFHELGFTLGGPTPDPHAGGRLGYFWNVWAYTDLLSFRAQGIAPGAHDTAFPLSGLVRSDHLAYLQQPDFYRTLAAKVAVHAGPREPATPPLESGA